MSVYPFELDDDTTLPRVDDNITETGQEAINALRDAVFNVQETLGIEPQGSVTTVANRLDTSLNPDGTIRASALASIGLVTLPITNNQVGSNAGIEESKLSLVHSTADLYTLIVAADTLINSVKSLAEETSTDFNLHLSGANLLSDGLTSARHVLSHIDLNSIPSDLRDPLYTWTGLKDKNNNLRAAVTAADGLLAVNDALVDHETLPSAHQANAIDVDTDNFIAIPVNANTVQSALDYLDRSEVINMGQHRATQHANAIPKISRSDVIGLDGYGHNVVPPTNCFAYLTNPPNTFPVDDLSVGDDIIKFNPDNSNFVFDALFSQVRVGDIIRVNYANGLEAIYPINSIRFTPNSEWLVRINGINLCAATDGYASARIDRALYDVDTAGVFAAATANARTSAGPTATNVLSSLIVADPRGAMALGLNFDANQLNSTHYNLYLEFYPTGNPSDKVISLPAIDVTGNAGATPGLYTLSSIVSTTNDKFREFGYNYRFIAFENKGEFGIMLADSINNASFAIINGTNVSGALSTGSYTNNVIGGNNITTDTFDALGFGSLGSNLASPAYQSTWASSSAAQIPTKVIRPLKHRYAIINGQKVDRFKDMYLATDGYWDGYVSSRIQVGSSTVETTYTVESNLAPSGIRAGSTIIVQPSIQFSDPLYNDVDYGRFIVKSVNFIGECGTQPALTQITVLNSISGQGVPVTASANPNLPVKLYFSYDSVTFNLQNLIDTGYSSADYKRFHEIHVTDEGKTFSHERLRMPIQSESANLLNTFNFHIIDVSPKLKGYFDGNPLIFNKYLRFYVLNYDLVTGEFDGYLGQRVPSTPNVVKTGNIVKGKKNITTRFYDETNIDYVDILFSDINSSPGSLVMSTSFPRYVDLEIFSTLRTDDELFLLATCEVNWDPLSNQNIIQYLSNRREFGSVDETDFTDSAKEYISSANKYLHNNGIIRGLDFEATLGGGEIRFNGGSAIISGKVITANNQGIVIPQIYTQSTSLPQNLNWAICLNESGNLVSIVLTSSKQIFFATNGVQNYQIYSATFNEIINERKDLCLVALANVTIASITINSVTDARKFVQGLDSAAPLVWSSEEDYLGNFYSFEAVKTWINNSNGKNNNIKLKGNFIFTDNVDLTGFVNLVKFDGSESEIDFNPTSSGKGILIDSNLHLENWTINYNPTGISYTPNNTRNGGGGCLYFVGGDGTNYKEINNVVIRGCSFISGSAVDQHHPFINFEYNSGDQLKNILIENNKFEAVNPSASLVNYQSAIVFYNLGTAGTVPALIKNVIINANFSNKNHNIYITSATTNAPGTNVNCIISNNTIGTIGYFIGSDGTESYDTNNSLIIRNNFVKFISSFFNDFSGSGGVISYGTGNVIIEGNISNWIRTIYNENKTYKSSVFIKNNKLFGYDIAVQNIYRSTPITTSTAISCDNQNTDGYLTPYIIENNSINFGFYNSIEYGYDFGVSTAGPGNIINNNIAGLNTGAYGIYFRGNGVNIRFNNIHRQGKEITSYIHARTTGSSVQGTVSDNIYDDVTVDGGSTALSNIVPGNSSYKFLKYINNRNATLNQGIEAISGFHSINDYLVHPTFNSSIEFQNFSTTYSYTDTGVTLTFKSIYPLLSVLPPNVKIINIYFKYRITANPDTVGSIQIVFTDSYGNTSNPPFIDLTSITPLTIYEYNESISDGSCVTAYSNLVGKLRLQTAIRDTSSSIGLEIFDIQIKALYI